MKTNGLSLLKFHGPHSSKASSIFLLVKQPIKKHFLLVLMDHVSYRNKDLTGDSANTGDVQSLVAAVL